MSSLRAPVGDRSHLRQQIPSGELTAEQVKALVTALRDIVGVLADADPTAKAEVYNDLGLRLDYSPDGTVSVEARPCGGNPPCRRGDLNPCLWLANPYHRVLICAGQDRFSRTPVPARTVQNHPVSRSFADILMTSG